MDDGPKKREEEEKEARLWKLRETFLRRRAESKISYKRRRRRAVGLFTPIMDGERVKSKRSVQKDFFRLNIHIFRFLAQHLLSITSSV